MAQAYWRVKRNGKWQFVPQVVQLEDGSWHHQKQPDCECYYCNRKQIVLELVPKEDDSN